MSVSDWDIVSCQEFVLNDCHSSQSERLSEKSVRSVDSFQDLISSAESVMLDAESDASGEEDGKDPVSCLQYVIGDAESVMDCQSDASSAGDKELASREYVIADADSVLDGCGDSSDEDVPVNQLECTEVEDANIGPASAEAGMKAADLLWRGWWDGEVAIASEIDKEEGAALGHVLVVGTASALQELARQVERDCCKPPEAYVCSRTGQLMFDPVVDDEGMVCDRAVADDPCHTSPELKGEIEVFRRHHTHSILALVPQLIHEGSPEVATRLLRLAEDLSQGLMEASTLQAKILELTEQLPCATDNLRVELILLMVRRAQFRELVSRFAELQVARYYGYLSMEELSRLYSAAWLQEWKVGRKVHRTRMEIGRALVARLNLVEATEPERDVGLQKLRVLFDLHYADPVAEDLHKPLAAACAQRLPLSGDNNLGVVLAKLPLKVVEAAIEQALAGGCSTTARSAAVLVSAAQRFKPQRSANLYRAALHIDPECSEARQGLTSCLLHLVSTGTATRGDRADLVRLLIGQGAFSLLSIHFDALRPWIKHEDLSLEDRQALASALFAADRKRPAARFALSVAKELDQRVNLSVEAANTALDWHIKSCSWAGCTGPAKEALDTAWFQTAVVARLWSFAGQH